MLKLDPTSRAYTLKLAGDQNWRELLWNTHVVVNRGVQVWGDWLLTLRGGLPPSLATNNPQLQVLLALSWLSVESPVSLAPHRHIVTTGAVSSDEKNRAIKTRFRQILDRLPAENPADWEKACLPALTARIRDDAVWVDRSQCFLELQQRFPGITADWASNTLFALLGGIDDYFAMPDIEGSAATESKDFVQKAGGWLSRNWGAGKKSDKAAISEALTTLAHLPEKEMVGHDGRFALAAMIDNLGLRPEADADAPSLFKQLKQAIGWKGRSSKGAIALEAIRDAKKISSELWQKTVAKLQEEAEAQSSKVDDAADHPAWMDPWRAEMEQRLGMPYRTSKDHIWEHGVMLDHALRRLSAGHTWIKRAEAARNKFRENAAKISAVPQPARKWLDTFRDERASNSNSLGEYLIQKRAIDGWEKIVEAWDELGDDATRTDRIKAVGQIQANLDDNEKFGDIQLFAGFGDKEDESPLPCLADDDARCVWQDPQGKADAQLLKNYVEATVAENDQLRFKVPAYRHPDPLRNPVYVDFGNSRWGISYSALKETQQRDHWQQQLAKAKTEKVREKLLSQLQAEPRLRLVSLDVWTGDEVESLPLRWQSKRLWRDLDLDHFGISTNGVAVARADRLGRVAVNQRQTAAVNIAGLFDQKDWNGRLQMPRKQLDQLADIVYGKSSGKRLDPDYSKLDQLSSNSRAHQLWKRLNWFTTTSAKLQPHGPWLNYIACNLPDGVEYRKGKTGYYLNYSINQNRKGRARLLLSRLPDLRIISLDLGHRYAAACAVWQAVSTQQMLAACQNAGQPAPTGNQLYVHLQIPTNKTQRHGKNKGKPVIQTVVYRRLGATILPDGNEHPAPWARLERQFLVKLQGEQLPTRRAFPEELTAVNHFRTFIGLPLLTELSHIDNLHKDTLRQARVALRRFGDMARIAYAMIATSKPASGRKSLPLSENQRIEYLQDALLNWHQLVNANQNEWASQRWQEWIVDRFGGIQPPKLGGEFPRADQKKLDRAIWDKLRPVAAQLADPQSPAAQELHNLWADEWRRREAGWRQQLRWLRRFVLPRAQVWKNNRQYVRNLGGLSLRRLQVIRNLYQVLKSFRMRPEPNNLLANVPELGDASLAQFGRRILNQLERLREQRIKQLASRIVEAALGAGRTKTTTNYDRKRPDKVVDPPCHAVVVEDLENYRPEETRLRSENRRLMDWAARNVRKYIVESCQLHGLHFVEVTPAFTSKLDSRTGSPGIRCEDIPRNVLAEAVRRLSALPLDDTPSAISQKLDRDVVRWLREIQRIRQVDAADLSPRDQVLVSAIANLNQLSKSVSTIRLPRRGGEIFVSANPSSPTANGIQADLNAAANIGLKALIDPDWQGAWDRVLVEDATGQPVRDKILGSAVWNDEPVLLPPVKSVESAHNGPKRPPPKRCTTRSYAWKANEFIVGASSEWVATDDYWSQVDQQIVNRLKRGYGEPENPF